MMFMFSECKLLSKLPDLSKWDTSKVSNFSYMFNECESLTYLPDISIWDNSESSRYINRCISLSFSFSFRISKSIKKISNDDFIVTIKVIRHPKDCINCTNI